MKEEKQKARLDLNSVYNRKRYRRLNELPHNHLSNGEEKFMRMMYLREEYACGLDG